MVRAASFIENWLHPVSAVKSGQSSVVGSSYQKLDRKIPHVSAEYMIKSKNELDSVVIIELDGPEPYSPNDVAQVTSEASGKPVQTIGLKCFESSMMVRFLGQMIQR